jgi:hypothetical protein
MIYGEAAVLACFFCAQLSSEVSEAGEEKRGGEKLLPVE